MGKSYKHKIKNGIIFFFISVGGLISLIWFLVRVIPKPTRVTYPCQQAAFPLSTSFLIWIFYTIISSSSIRKVRHWFSQSRYGISLLFVVISLCTSLLLQNSSTSRVVLANTLISNTPLGIGKGVNPGRVVWVHNPEATDWDGPGKGHWWEDDNTNQSEVDNMLKSAILALSGKQSNYEAWESFFEHFNRKHGKNQVGYKADEKIVIKVNFVGTIKIWDDKPVIWVDDLNLKNPDYMNTTPQVIMALLRQLVEIVGVKEENITVGDPLSYFPNQFYKMCYTEFPKVKYLDFVGKFGRTAAALSSSALYWSTPVALGKNTDYVPQSYVEADYLINIANLKSHGDQAGITLCAKNHYGSLLRKPTGSSEYYDMHENLPSTLRGNGHYRPLVDLMGHNHLGGKTLLYVIDGLFAGQHAKEKHPRKWNSAPFNGDWSSSLLLSQDPVAIDSVGFDLLYSEWDDASHWPGVNDYLIEAALADNPPSGTFYDPNHKGNMNRIQSLGVYEHWNNSTDKKYSRNMGKGEGIELIKL